jgi:hypothetical protein
VHVAASLIRFRGVCRRSQQLAEQIFGSVFLGMSANNRFLQASPSPSPATVPASVLFFVVSWFIVLQVTALRCVVQTGEFSRLSVLARGTCVVDTCSVRFAKVPLCLCPKGEICSEPGSRVTCSDRSRVHAFL